MDLGEYIEDISCYYCEYTELSCEHLHLLSTEAKNRLNQLILEL